MNNVTQGRLAQHLRGRGYVRVGHDCNGCPIYLYPGHNIRHILKVTKVTQEMGNHCGAVGHRPKIRWMKLASYDYDTLPKYLYGKVS